MKVMIAVTHLLGAGHLSRAVTLARAFSNAGHDVSVLSGGRAAPHLDMTGFSLVQAPSLASDGTNFTRLLDEDGAPAGMGYLERRADQMVAALRETCPDVLITELFPFGRRALSAEFLALLEAARELPNRPLILSSIRDILAPPSKPAKATRADEILIDFYDGVLVHSDQNITRLQESWPVSNRLEQFLNYTGYVAPFPAGKHPRGDGTGEVLVSAGGGSVGQAMFECALQAAARSPLHWHLLVGGADRDARIAALKELAGNLDVTIEAVRPDFREMLTGAAASVSMCGYNTALDLLQTGLPAVMVPFDDGGEVEQTLRSHSLASLPSAEVLASSDMNPVSMAEAVARVTKQGRRKTDGLKMDGAAQTVNIVERMLQGALT
ncbi:glycosyltransferase [Shimia sp.]|uniref:glycosyltransferase family protein n=1 Tax=Shimia sp. TaxID=1954381 RepID=UPI003296B4B0